MATNKSQSTKRTVLSHTQVVKLATFIVDNKSRLSGKTAAVIAKLVLKELNFAVSDSAVKRLCKTAGVPVARSRSVRQSRRLGPSVLALDVRELANDLKRVVEFFGADPQELLSQRTLAVIDRGNVDVETTDVATPPAAQQTLPFPASPQPLDIPPPAARPPRDQG